MTRPLNFFLLCAICLLLCSSSCRKEEQDCICPVDEVCVNDKCYTDSWVHHLGGSTIIARNSFVGTIAEHVCLDTLVFFNDTTKAIGQGRFGLFIAEPFGVLDILGAEVADETALNSYFASTVAPVCYLNGDSWYANLHYTHFPDSVVMDFWFWTLDGDPAGIIDSCQVIFYRKE